MQELCSIWRFTGRAGANVPIAAWPFGGLYMFTGLVEAMVRLVDLEVHGPGKKFFFDLGTIAEGVQIGDSIALNGCCLTVVEIDGSKAAFEAGEETLRRTNLGKLTVGDHANAERSLRVGDRMGGHFVTGHIDGLGTIVRRRDDGDWSFFYFAADRSLLRQMASKGSVAVDGISLTLVDVF